MLSRRKYDLSSTCRPSVQARRHRTSALIWPHEVLNALLVGEKRKRISKEMVHSFLDDLATLPVTLEQSPAGIVFDRIQGLSRKHGLTAYDAAYLDLALESGLALATADEALVRACKNLGAGLVRL